MSKIARDMAARQREISISEFFTKNRHLLGFDNPKRALMTTIKEAVDNSLDACEEGRILPEVTVQISQIEGKEDQYVVEVDDNGPGIIKSQIPKIFGKLLYGSKFHSLKMSRGQQGIGISAAGLYGQLTTGQPVTIVSRTGKGSKPHMYKIHINTQKNKPDIIEDKETKYHRDHGTKVKIYLEAKMTGGRQSVEEYIFQTAVANPHVELTYIDPAGKETNYERVTKKLPKEPREIKPHPYGVELGVLMKMLTASSSKKIITFLTSDFSRVGRTTAKQILDMAGISYDAWTKRILREEAENLYRAINKTKIMSPPTDCITPINENEILKSLKKMIKADFYTAVTRSPSVYRGNPFQIEMGLAYGGDLPQDSLMQIYRFANRVPLLYQKSACCITQSIQDMKWRNYGIPQSRGALPQAPIIIMVHMASVWVPFTSESKEAIAPYPEIEKEIKLVAQECGRKLQSYLRKEHRVMEMQKKRSYMDKYVKHIGYAIQEILNINDTRVKKINRSLNKILDRSTKI